MPALSFRNKILLLLITCMCMTQVSTMLATVVSTEKTVRQSIDKNLQAAETVFDQLLEQHYQQLTQAAGLVASDSKLNSAFTSASGDLPLLLAGLKLRLDTPLLAYIDVGSGMVYGLDEATVRQQVQALVNQQMKTPTVISSATIRQQQFQIVLLPLDQGYLLLGQPIDNELLAQFRAMTGLEISIFDLSAKNSSNIASTLNAEHEQLLIKQLQNFGLLASNHTSAFDLTLHHENYLTRAHLIAGTSRPIFAIMQKSLQQEMQPIHNLDWNLLTLLVQVIIVAILGSVFISGSVIAPVKTLAELAERIGRGNYDIEIKVKSSDEIGQLGNTLNIMQHEIAERERKIVYQSQHDDLTGLPNRYLLNDRIKTAIHRAERQNTNFTLVMMDIARFKQVNDTLGHHIGDQVLRKTATRLGQRQRKTDTLARMGGDDFLLLLEDTSLVTALALVQDNLMPLLHQAMEVDDTDISLRFHFGLAEFPVNGDSAESLLRRAEIALYEAKTLPGHLSVYQNGRDETHLRQLTIASDIEAAMHNGQLKLCYQPKVNLLTGATACAEALVRWQHPVFGALSPEEFIPILEQTGKIEKLTAWIINAAAQQCRSWLNRNSSIQLSINLSALDLQNPQLPELVLRSISQHKITSAHLVLEITESAFMHDPANASILLTRLRKAGFRIAIDDFGTGYSSLAQLKSLPLDELKIDKAFVQELTAGSQDAVIVKSTIELAHSMNLLVIAEGIETLQALELLQSYGCDVGQGYYFNQALSASDFECWHKANRHLAIVSNEDAA